jgi:hypothetical protein
MIAGLQAAIASVRTDDGPNGKRNDFEAAATHLLPYNPVGKKRLSETKKGAGINSMVSHVAEYNQTPITTGGKPSVGKTGVPLRYHKKQKYNKLS